MAVSASRGRLNQFVYCLVTLVSLCCPLGSAQQCLTLPSSSVCASILPYSSVSLHPAFSCLLDSEYALKQSPALLNLLDQASPHSSCAPALASLLCQAVYSPCTSNSSVSLPCSSACSAVQTACSPAVQQSVIAPFLSSLPASLRWPALSACTSSSYDASSACTPLPLPTTASIAPAPSCLAYSGIVCQGVVDYPVYVPTSVSIRGLEAQLSKSLSSVLLLAPVASGCRDALLKQMCSRTFLPCDAGVLQRTVGLPYSYAFPRLPCDSGCEQTQSTCGMFLRQYPQLAAAMSCNTSTLLPAHTSCSGAVLPGQPDYPSFATTFAVLSSGNASVAVSTSCYSPPAAVNVSVACPSPLVPASSTASILNGSCAVPYKSLLWSASEWAAGDTLMAVFSVLSFVSLAVVLATWTIFPVKRRQHHLHMFMLCQFLISLLFIVGLADTRSKSSTIGLPYADSPVAVDSPVCVFQASMLVFLVNAGVFWWTFIAFHLFLKVVLRYRLTTQQNNALTLTYHATTWLVSLLLTLIGGVKGYYGRSSVVPWCFFRDGTPAAADWLLFYIPIGVRGVVGCGLMLCVMVGLWKQGRLMSRMRAGSGSKAGSGRRSGGCWNNIRPLMFVCQFFIIFLFLIIFRAVLHFHQPAYTASAVQFVTCLLTSTDPSACGAKPALAPSVALLYLIILTTAGQGLVPGVIYLSQSSVWWLWRGLLCGEGVDGVSRTRGGDSSMRTESKAGNLSVNAMARRMSNKGLTGVSTMAEKPTGKAGGVSRKSGVSASGSAGSGTTVQASPVSKPITFTVSDEHFNSERSASPYPTNTVETIQTNYAGLRLSRSDSGGPPALALMPQWYHSAADSQQPPQPDWSVQLASIAPSAYSPPDIAQPVARSTFTSVPHRRSIPPVPPFELLHLPIAPDEAQSVQFHSDAEAAPVASSAVGSSGAEYGGGGGVEMAAVPRESVRMELPMDDGQAGGDDDEEEYRVTLHVDE